MKSPWTSKLVCHTSLFAVPYKAWLISRPMVGSASSEEDVGMDEVYDDEIKIVSEGKKTYEVDYKPLTLQQVKDLMVADIEYISTIFGVDVSLCVSVDEKDLLTFVIDVSYRATWLLFFSAIWTGIKTGLQRNTWIMSPRFLLQQAFLPFPNPHIQHPIAPNASRAPVNPPRSLDRRLPPTPSSVLYASMILPLTHSHYFAVTPSARVAGLSTPSVKSVMKASTVFCAWRRTAGSLHLTPLFTRYLVTIKTLLRATMSFWFAIMLPVTGTSSIAHTHPAIAVSRAQRRHHVPHCLLLSQQCCVGRTRNTSSALVATSMATIDLCCALSQGCG